MRRAQGRCGETHAPGWFVLNQVAFANSLTVLTAALYERFSSRGKAEFADRILSAMRYEFGGHKEKAPGH